MPWAVLQPLDCKWFLYARMEMKLIWILASATFLVVIHCARIEKNGYKEVIISFSEKSQRQDFDFTKLKVSLEMFIVILV